MEHAEEPRQTTDGLGSLDPSRLWILGLVVDDDGRIVGPGRGLSSAWGDCDCPGDCGRDHENE
jgi:hypothetical protein